MIIRNGDETKHQEKRRTWRCSGNCFVTSLGMRVGSNSNSSSLSGVKEAMFRVEGHGRIVDAEIKETGDEIPNAMLCRVGTEAAGSSSGPLLLRRV